MLMISHRGNLAGPLPERENSPGYISEAIALGYSVEVDVWVVDNQYWLGHDEPIHRVEEVFLKDDRLWCHAKNPEALEKMSFNNEIHYFWHQTDDYTLTSKGYVWTYPGKKLFSNSICVLPERANYDQIDCLGICSDFIQGYRDVNALLD